MLTVTRVLPSARLKLVPQNQEAGSQFGACFSRMHPHVIVTTGPQPRSSTWELLETQRDQPPAQHAHVAAVQLAREHGVTPTGSPHTGVGTWPGVRGLIGRCLPGSQCIPISIPIRSPTPNTHSQSWSALLVQHADSNMLALLTAYAADARSSRLRKTPHCTSPRCRPPSQISSATSLPDESYTLWRECCQKNGPRGRAKGSSVGGQHRETP